jgi:hypothetical protein
MVCSMTTRYGCRARQWAIATRAHAANLHDMHAKYADVVSVADVAAALPAREATA